MHIAGYSILEILDETELSAVYKARNNDTDTPVIIKLLKNNVPSSSDIAQYKHTYELINRNAIAGILHCLDIFYIDNQCVFVMEDFEGLPLHSSFKQPLNIEVFLNFAIRIVKIIRNLHRYNISHYNIKPSNIIYNNKDDILKLSDLKGGGINYSKSGKTDVNYISPEQTGRMNCTEDYRTDFYLLGITFYQLLTDVLPFSSEEQINIIHAHIAKRPEKPHKINSEIPTVVSDIIMKLLEKGAGERYQSSEGLLADLEHCREQLKAKDSIEPFDIAKHDVFLKFTFPQLLAGRENELAQLLKAFKRAVSGTHEVMLVSGQTGIGKSVLVNEIEKSVVADNGIFISGKYDQLWRNTPYSGVIQAFRNLIRSLLTESDTEIQVWKDKLLAALQPNAKVITDIIPEIKLIIGEQPKVPELAPAETQNRFKHLFKKLVKVFAEESHPLALVLDDLHWADPASIDLFEEIATDNSIRYFSLIGTYRQNEVAPYHPLMLAINAVTQAGVNFKHLELGPLTDESIYSIVSSFLSRYNEDCRKLAKVIHEKTLGNPFFVMQFLQTLYKRKYLFYDASNGWNWDIKKIQELQVTDNVADLMFEKVNQLSKHTLSFLNVCSCIGYKFNAEMLASVTEIPFAEVIDLLRKLENEGFFLPRKNEFQFLHDRIRESVYSQISNEHRKKVHYKIGTLALKQTDKKNLSNNIFYIVDQLNEGRSVISDQKEKERLAELNIEAGNKAKIATAYETAKNYFEIAMTLLPLKPWHTDYRLTYTIYKELMECRFLNRDFKGAKELFHIIVKNAESRIDKANAYFTIIFLYINTNSPLNALKLGLEALRLFGIKLSMNIKTVSVFAELVKVKILLRGKPLEKILDLPLMTDEDKITCHKIMNIMAMAAFYVNPNLFAIIALRSVKEILKYGVNSVSSNMLMSVAGIFANVLGQYDMSYRIGELALQLNEKLDEKLHKCEVMHVFAFFIQHWKKHAQYDIEVYKEEYPLCLNVGNFIFAGHSVNAAIDCRLMIGCRLDDIIEEAEKYRDLMSYVKDPFIETHFNENLQMAKCLKGLTKNKTSLSGSNFDEKLHLQNLYKEKNFFGVCLSLLLKLKLYYLYGFYKEACDVGEELNKHINVPVGTLIVPEYYFYYSLTLIALIKHGLCRKKRKAIGFIHKCQRHMNKWAHVCPQNFEHKNNLIKAELMSLKKTFQEAVALYHAAIKGARDNGYVNEEAVACERTAQFYLGFNAEEEAHSFLQKASRCYGAWGAIAKQKELESRWLLFSEHKNNTDEKNVHQFDLETVMQTSQAISNEIVLDNLLQKIMQISITNAGAQRGCLLLETEGQLTVVAEEYADQKGKHILKPVPIEKYDNISKAIVNYVYRSHEYVILSNASKEGSFVHDRYIIENRCKSILCMPILNKGKLTGILYMENNVAPDAFTEKRLEILKIVVSQAAISLDNARLFEKATTDGLTRLYVHQYFLFLFEHELSRSKRYNRPCALVFMDIDNFKRFNDTYGHQLGDTVLKEVAGVIKENIRNTDIAARYGGEEFVVVLPESTIEQAASFAEKIRELVENLDITYSDKSLSVTLSLGIASFPENAATTEELIRLADKALYKAKGDGKNCVRTAQII